MTAQRKRGYSKLHIRPAVAADSDFILSLVPRFVAFDLPKGRTKRKTLSAIRTDIERALHDDTPADRFFVSEDTDAARTGFLHLQIQRDFFSGVRACHISDLAVAERHDGQGIGHALLEHSQKWAKKHRCKLLTLSVFPGNARARALYETTGLVPDLLRMTKLIK